MTNGKQKLERSEEARNETGTQRTGFEALRAMETGHRLSSELSRRHNLIPAVQGPEDTNQPVAEGKHDSPRPRDQRGLFLASWNEELALGTVRSGVPKQRTDCTYSTSRGLLPVLPSVPARVPEQGSQSAAFQLTLSTACIGNICSAWQPTR